MNDILFIWDKKGKSQSYIDLTDDFETTQSTREILIYGALAIEELCYFIYKKYLEEKSILTTSRLKKFRNASFAEKINTLELLCIIEFDIANRIRKIKDTRNNAAHNLMFNDIKYNKKIMPSGITEFKKDCLTLWAELKTELDTQTKKQSVKKGK